MEEIVFIHLVAVLGPFEEVHCVRSSVGTGKKLSQLRSALISLGVDLEALDSMLATDFLNWYVAREGLTARRLHEAVCKLLGA